MAFTQVMALKRGTRHARVRAPRSGVQVRAEKIRCGMIGLEPTLLGEEAMDLVGKNELLEFDALFAKRFDQGHGLLERDIAVVIAMDQ
jgi:hypothetical protein